MSLSSATQLMIACTARSLDGKVALVTGASRGIGRAVVVRLAAEGASIVLNDHAAEQAAIEEVQELVCGRGRDLHVVEADVTDAAAVQRMVKGALDRFDHIDILVNNAGIARRGPIHSLSEADWDRILDVNLKGQFLVARAILGGMRCRRTGAIVNVASELGLVGRAEQAPYCASKAGVIGFTKSLARELAPFSVRVNCVAPGPTDTALLGHAERTHEYIESI